MKGGIIVENERFVILTHILSHVLQAVYLVEGDGGDELGELHLFVELELENAA